MTECCVEDHRNEPSILDAWLKNKTPQNVENWFTDAGNFPVIVEVDGAIAGVAVMSGVGEVNLCYLLPEARFAGAGKALLSTLELEANRRGLNSLRLESTLTAKPFYLRNGFVESGTPSEVFGTVAFPMQKIIVANEDDSR